MTIKELTIQVNELLGIRSTNGENFGFGIEKIDFIINLQNSLQCNYLKNVENFDKKPKLNYTLIESTNIKKAIDVTFTSLGLALPNIESDIQNVSTVQTTNSVNIINDVSVNLLSTLKEKILTLISTITSNNDHRIFIGKIDGDFYDGLIDRTSIVMFDEINSEIYELLFYYVD
jgi:hypothetical protein